MDDIIKQRKSLNLLVVLAYSVILSFFLLSLNTLKFSGLNDVSEEEKFPNTIKSANGDITAPNITFVNTEINNTSIRTRYFEFMVNITDANPPLPGNVSIEISSNITSLFNASMNFAEGDLWFFLWNNLTSYPNKETYTVRIAAKDSSLNENYGFSSYLNVILDYYNANSPSLINVVFYIIVVCLLFAVIMVYINKKRTFLKTLKE